VLGGSSINAGLGADTFTATLATEAALTSLTASTNTTSMVMSGVETVALTVTANTAVLTIGNLPASLQTITVSGTDLSASLSATTTATGQTVTVNNTTGTNASNISVGNFATQTITTGSAGDTVTIAGGSATKGIVVKTGIGNDTVTVTTTEGLTGVGNILDGGTGTDTLALYRPAASENFDFAALITAGTIVGFEAVSFLTEATTASTHALTAGTGITSYTVNTTVVGNIYNLSATATQAAAITALVDSGTVGLLNLSITTAGTVNLSAATLTAVDQINYQDVAVTLTLPTAATAVVQGATSAGTASQTVQFAQATTVLQSVTFSSTGTVTFNVPTAWASGAASVDAIDITMVAPAASTTRLSFVGAAATTLIQMVDSDMIITNANIDTVLVGGVTGASTFTWTTGPTRLFTVDATEFTSAQVVYTFVTDNAGTAASAITISGFDAGTGGDILRLSDATFTTIAANVNNITTTGFSYIASSTAVGAESQVLILQASAFQISGALTQVGDAGEVERVIAAAAIIGSTSALTSLYVALDNGVDTGIYRMTTVLTVAGGSVNESSEIAAVTLVAVLSGISDVGTLNSANFVS